MTTAARPHKRRELGAQTRERILEAASELMASQGYAATSIGRISAAAGVQPASIYWAFESKEGLLAAVVDRAASNWFAAVLDWGRPATLDEVWDRVAGLSAPFSERPEFLRLLLLLSLERRDGDPAVLRTARDVRELGVTGFADLLDPFIPIESDAKRRDLAVRVGRLLIMLLDGVFVAGQIEPDLADTDRDFAMIVTSLRATFDRLVTDAMTNQRSNHAAHT